MGMETPDIADLSDIANKKPEDLSPEEIERLMSNPQIRELQHKLQFGGDKFKLEVTNQKPQEIRNISVREGASHEEQMAAIQEAMAEDQKNKEREKAEEDRRLAKIHAERMKRSDVWCYVMKGAGSEKVNGTYYRMGDSIRNGARVYQGPHDYMMSREAVSGSEGWIVGKAPRAFYAFQTTDKLAPEENWSVQEHGKAPAPTVTAVEPAEAVEASKRLGNSAFKEGKFEEAVAKYDEALRIAAVCAGVYGLTDDVLGKLHGNRSEALLQLGRYADAVEDADRSIECDPCFVKAYVRKAKALHHQEKWAEANAAINDALDVLPGNKEVLSLQEEYRVAALARSGTEAALTELAGLCNRFGTLVRRKGMASEVAAILAQMPMLLQALRAKPDKDAVGGQTYEQSPNHDAQVYLRLSTNNFALLAPLIRPNTKPLDLLSATLETLAAGLSGCPTNQVAFDKYVPQLVPLLRNKDSLPLEVLRGATKTLGAMAHRASARRVMHDPDTAEGLMHVLSYPDSSSQRLHLAIIAALDDMKDVNTIANLLSVPGAGDTFWREAHSRVADVNGPSRSLVATAMTSALCRKRLNLTERCKRVVDLFEKICDEAKVVEEYTIGPMGADPDDDDDWDSVKWGLRDIASLPKGPTSVLTRFVEGLGPEVAADAELCEALTRHRVWTFIGQMIVARPPLSTAALRIVRVGMQQQQVVIDRICELGIPMWLLQCREPSEASDDFNANVSTTILSQAARDDALQILGYAANQGVFHECAELFDTADVLHSMMELMDGNPSDDASCGGCRALSFLLQWKKGKRRAALSTKDVHDILIPLYLRKQDSIKDAVAKTLRVVLSDQAWIEKAAPYFEERGSSGKLYQVIQELNALEDLKQEYKTGKKADKLRPGNKPLEDSLESTHRLGNLQPSKVVEYFCREVGADATVVDVGAGTGIFAFAFASALPEGRVIALEVRSDAIRAMRTRAKRNGVSNVSVVRMGEAGVPALPDGAKADLVFVCDVLEFVAEADREEYAGRLRALLKPDGKLVVINDRSLTDTFLIDIQDAGFLQRRCAQIVSGRRVMLFDPDPAAPAPPALAAPPAELPEDSEEYTEELPAAAAAAEEEAPTGQAAEADAERGRDVDDDDDECLLEDNPLPAQGVPVPKPAAATRASKDVEDESDEDGCVLEEQQQEECLLEDNAQGGGDDDDGCELEDNHDASAPPPPDDDDDGCMLEDNGGEDDDDDDCMLEDN